MTLQEFTSEQKLLVSEYNAFRAKTVLPDYHLNWTVSQWHNRWQGRTQLTNSEIYALCRILDAIRHPQETTINLN